MRIALFFVVLTGCASAGGAPPQQQVCSAFPVPLSKGTQAADLSQLTADPTVEPPRYWRWDLATVDLPAGWTPVGGGPTVAVGAVIVACKPK